VLASEHKGAEKICSVDSHIIPVTDCVDALATWSLFVSFWGQLLHLSRGTGDEQLQPRRTCALRALSGRPKLVVPITPRRAAKALPHDPDLNPTYQEMAMPLPAWAWFRRDPTSRATRPRSNRGVCCRALDIRGARHRKFFSIEELTSHP